MSIRDLKSPFIELKDVRKSFGHTAVLNGVDLAVARSEVACIIGPSGSGKSTVLRCINALTRIDGGSVRVGDTRVDDPRLDAQALHRRVGIVFQGYNLFPHCTVLQNVMMAPIQVLRRPRDEVEAQARALLAKVHLAGKEHAYPGELSGGQQQRVALARSMVMEPKVLMLDEPLSNLDARLRLEMRTELQRVQKESGVTMIFVTHDQIEALALADRIVVMRNGAIEQIGTPEDIYNRPESAFVADFVGFENIFALKDGQLVTPGGTFPIADAPADAAALAWRPRAVALGNGPFSGVVRSSSFAGSAREYLLDTPLGPIKAEADAAHPAHALGDTVGFGLPAATAATLRRFG